MSSIDEKEPQDCWKFLTTGEKVLLLFLAFVSFLLVALLLFISILFLKRDVKCETVNCVKASARILEIIDSDISPCENFQDFVCNKIQHEEKALSKDFLRRKKAFIKKLFISEPVTLLNPKKFLEICSNSSPAIREENLRKLETFMDFLGGWPLLLGQNWNESKFHWLKFMVSQRNLGIRNNWLLDFNWSETYNETGCFGKLLKIIPPTLFMSRRKQLYSEVMVKIGVEFGASEIMALSEMKKVLDFENQLFLITEEALEVVDETTCTLEELNRFWPDINLVGVLNDLAKGYKVFNNNSMVELAPEGFILNLNALLAKTPRRVQANFLFWKIIENLIPFLPDNFKIIYDEYKEVGTLDDFCLNQTLERWYQEISQQYLKRFFNHSSENGLKQAIDLIGFDFSELETALDQTSKGDDEEFVFFTDNILTMLNEYNFNKANEFYDTLQKSSINCELYNETQPNVFYDLLSDLKDFTLYSEMYEAGRPNYLNYAGLGALIAIEEGEKLTNTSQLEVKNSVDQTYEGYIKWTQIKGTEKMLPALNYTTNQLFWIQLASFFCNNNNLLVIQESKYFLHDFNCT